MFTTDANGWDYQAYVLLAQYEAKGYLKGEWMLGVMASESGLDTRAYNKNGGAQGINQMMPQVLRNMHLAVDGYRDLPASKQMEYAIRYFEEWRTRFKLPAWSCRESLYLCNFLPALLPVATLPDSIVVDRDRAPAIYNANPGLDANHDGRITLGELGITIDHAINGYAKVRYEMALKSYAEVKQDLTTGTNSANEGYPTWASVQQELAKRGFYKGPIDGIPGPQTLAAVGAMLSS